MEVLVVGASRGFGLALATSYASSGAIVHATVRNTTRASMDSLAHQIGGNVQLHALDVRSKDQLAALADDPTIRKLDLLIHSAGINQGSFDVQRRVNAEAPFEVINAMLPRLQASRQPRVCLVTSNMGTDAQVKHQRRKGLTSSIYVYALTKLMANRRFRQLEPEWRAAGITAVALHPGWMATDMTGGSGLITANASAERVRTLLEALPFDAVGAWFDWSGARLDWRTGKPTTTSGVSVQPTSSSSVTGPPQVSRWIRDDQSGRSARSWGPLVGGSVAELLKQHHDPLHALSEGKVSAVVLKNQLKAEELERLTKRLEGPELSQLWSIGGGPKGGFGTIGVQLAKALPHHMSPSRFAREGASFVRTFRQKELFAPITVLLEGLRLLGAGRIVRPGIDVHTNTSFAPGIYRYHSSNATFNMHFDFIRTVSVLATACGRRPRPAGNPNAFRDMARFDKQFSALVLLQRSSTPTPELSVFKTNMDDIASNCTLSTYPTHHNCHVGGLDTAQLVKSQPVIEAGDLYIFNSQHVHVVEPIDSTLRRITLGSFVSFSDREMVVWT